MDVDAAFYKFTSLYACDNWWTVKRDLCCYDEAGKLNCLDAEYPEKTKPYNRVFPDYVVKESSDL